MIETLNGLDYNLEYEKYRIVTRTDSKCEFEVAKDLI